MMYADEIAEELQALSDLPSLTERQGIACEVAAEFIWANSEALDESRGIEEEE